MWITEDLEVGLRELLSQGRDSRESQYEIPYRAAANDKDFAPE
jgi:hypothetical protein